MPFLILAVLFCVASLGLQQRAVWAWYAGWLVLFLAAGVYGTFTFSGLYNAQTAKDVAFAFVYLAGGALLWIPAAVWWCNRRSFFGRRRGPRSGTSESQSKKTDAQGPTP